MKQQIIIILSGRKQSGKSTITDYLINNSFSLWNTSNIRKFSMATKLKRFCIDVMGLTEEQCYGTDEQKNSLTKYKWENFPNILPIENISENLGYFPGSCIKLGSPKEVEYYLKLKVHEPGFMTAREVLQQFGTNICRRMNTNIWAEACARDIFNSNVNIALIDDCRFPNEISVLKDMEKEHEGIKVISVRLTRNIFPEDKHESETSLDKENYDWKNFDIIINNDNLNIAQQNSMLYAALENYKYV